LVIPPKYHNANHASADQATQFDWQNPYIVLTPGPLSTSPTARAALLRDWCTWDDDYNLGIVTPIRKGCQIASATKPGLPPCSCKAAHVWSKR
jgi:hypothetical protein